MKLVRTRKGALVGGVAAGLGAAVGIAPAVVRLAFVVCTFAGGVGVLVYLVLWVAVPPGEVRAEARPRVDWVQIAALGAVVLGVLLFANATGVLPTPLAVVLATVACGLALVWARPVDDPRGEDQPPSADVDRFPASLRDAAHVVGASGPGARMRIAGGAVLVLAGALTLVVTVDSWQALGEGLLAGVVVLAGVALVVGPGLVRLAGALGEERRERIRSQERAEMAAHLHDSVLQTLALVQRRADDRREVVRLARRQERALRAWLRDREPPVYHGDESFGRALDRVAAEVEETFGVPVEVVRVRDCRLDERLELLVLATREAATNAARHSGAREVTVYAEVTPERTTVFVRDRGDGFDPSAVPDDRRGLRESVVGRMARNGGRATVRSEAGEGTEIELVMPRVRSAVP